MNILRLTKKIGLWALPLLLLSSTLTFFLPAPVFAAGERYEWTSNTSIRMFGGDLQIPGVLSASGANQNTFQGSFTHKTGCTLYLALSIRTGTNNQGSVHVTTSKPPKPNTCSGAISDPYETSSGVWVNIEGVRPGPGDAAETPEQKYVTTRVNSPQRNGDSPQTLTATIKNASGQTVDEKSFQKRVVGDEPDINQKAAYYDISFSLEGSAAPGTPYSICFNAIVGTCYNFNKIKYIPAGLPQFGELSTDRTIAVQIKGSVNIPAGEGFHIGPLNATIEKPDGTGKVAKDSTIYDYANCDNRQPGHAPDDLECKARGTGVQIPINPSVTSFFDGVEPGEYKICVPALNQCKNDTKNAGMSLIVVFNATAAQLQAIASGAVGDEESPRCETNGNPLTWIMCPIFNGLTGIADWILLDVLQPLLRSDPVDLNPNSSVYKIWSAFRVYGNIVLLIALIVAVFGQVIGGGIVEAYTARRMLPRILLAAVLINLSIYIVALAVDVSNVVGFAIADLIITPVQATAQFTFTPNDGITVATTLTVGAGIFAAWFAGFFTLGGLAAAAPFILLFVVIPAVMALIGVFVTIILLHALIFFLIIISPVAFALYCLPNTERYFRTWWDWLFRALLVYPIIMIIFAIADIMSVAIVQANG